MQLCKRVVQRACSKYSWGIIQVAYVARIRWHVTVFWRLGNNYVLGGHCPSGTVGLIGTAEVALMFDKLCVAHVSEQPKKTETI